MSPVSSRKLKGDILERGFRTPESRLVSTSRRPSSVQSGLLPREARVRWLENRSPQAPAAGPGRRAARGDRSGTGPGQSGAVIIIIIIIIIIISFIIIIIITAKYYDHYYYYQYVSYYHCYYYYYYYC